MIMNAILNTIVGAQQHPPSGPPEFLTPPSQREHAVRDLPAHLTCHLSSADEEEPSPESLGFYACGEENVWWGLGVKAVLLLLVLLTSLRGLQAAVREVGPIGLTVGELIREVDFYTKVLPFEVVSRTSTAV